MRNLRNLSLLLLLLMATLGLQAQNGNAVISEVKVYDMRDGTGIITVRVSGNLASQYTGGVFSVSGDRVPGGTAGGGIGTSSRVPVESPAPGNGNGNSNGNQAVILAGVFPLAPATGNQSDIVELNIQAQSNNLPPITINYLTETKNTGYRF